MLRDWISSKLEKDKSGFNKYWAKYTHYELLSTITM